MTPMDLALIERIERAEQTNQPVVLLVHEVRQMAALLRDLQDDASYAIRWDDQ